MASLPRRVSWTALTAALPRGGALPDHAWDARHRGIVALLWMHVVVLVVIGVLRDRPLAACVLAPAVVAACALAASWARLSRMARASMATLGLLASCAILIDDFDGLIEAHFHFFIVIAVVSLYQSWRPYLLGIGFVLTHHLVMGTLMPHRVYNHPMAGHDPWLFALVHGGAILAESVACLVFWRLTEEAVDAERANGEALARTNAELKAANTAVADLVAMLSHDLRVPVTVLIGYSEMALESWPQMTHAEQVEFVRKVGHAGQNLHTMLEDTLAVSAIDGDGVDPRPVPVRVDEAVLEALANLPEPTPEIDLEGLGALTVLVDRSHLGQVLTNLLTNAVKYGDGRLAVSTVSGDDGVRMRITDSGPGVPPAFVPQLFDRYTRSDEARQGAQKGTGLGLYITRTLLLANGGDITYEATPGGGATFCVQLPRAGTTGEPALAAARGDDVRSPVSVVGG